MSDPSMTPEAPDVAETVNFLRRFADLMSGGNNATNLRHAADLLETLTARVTAASEEENLWRHKYETLTGHADALEAQCDALKQDIEGHLDVASSILTERDALRATLQARETELSELRETLIRERGKLATKLQAHEEVVAGLHAAFDREREGFKATVEKSSAEIAGLRLAFEREREELKATIKAGEQNLGELRLSFDRERDELQARLKVRGDELAALRVVSDREQEALRKEIAALETKRAELRSAFDRIGHLGSQTIELQDGADRSISRMPGFEAIPLPAQRGDRDSAVGETNAVVPISTLRQARAQFEYLAREFIPLGDVASQVMCELGAYTMDLALITGQQTDHLPVSEVALSILAPPGLDVSGSRQDASTTASGDLGSAR